MKPYLLAVVATAAVGLVRYALSGVLDEKAASIPFVVPVIVAAWYGGLRPGLLATALGTLVGNYLFVPPNYSLVVESVAEAVALGLFVVCGVTISGLCEAMHVARRRVDGDRVRLRASEERFRLAADAVNGIIYECDFATGHVERTRGLYEVLGHRPDDVPPTQAWWLEQIHPEDLKRVTEVDPSVVRADNAAAEYRVRHKDGRWLYVEDRAVLVRDGDGRPVKLIGCTTDVTARTEAEAELRRRATFTSGILGSITDAFLVVDGGWRVTFANDAILRRTGLGRDEFVGGQLWELFPVAVEHKSYVQLHRAMADRVAVEYEVFYERYQQWYLDKAYPTDDGGLAVYTRDITDNKLAEERLRASEERFRAAIRATSDILWANDAAGKMIDTQPGWGEFTGQSFDEYQGYGWTASVHPDDAQPTIDAWERTVAERQPFEFEHRLRRHDGEYRLCSIRAVFLLDGHGAIREWVGVHSDITEQRASERALKEADQKKDEFLATLAHELRNPLAPIRNSLQIMKLAGGDAGAVEKSRSVVERQVEQMTRLIDDLMDLSRISQGKIVLQKARLRLADVVPNVVDTSRPLIEERGHELVLAVPSEPIFVDGDSARLCQVFANVAVDSVKQPFSGLAELVIEWSWLTWTNSNRI